MVEAALREAEEEVGLKGVEPLGFLSPTYSPRASWSSPWWSSGKTCPLKPNPEEVAEILLAPWGSF